MKTTLLTLMGTLFAVTGFSQVQFWADNFEGSPTSGTRTPEENGGTTTAYFRLTDGTNISQQIPFLGKEGINYWAGEDHNAPGTGFTASGAQGAGTDDPLDELSIVWTSINISGKTNLSFRGTFAANSTNSAWDTKNSLCDGLATTNTDYIIVQYRVDGGAYVDLLRFFCKGGTNNAATKSLYEDTDGNNCGDGVQLTSVFGEFIKSIPATGTTLELRLLVYSESANEEWGVDNFRLFADPVCVAPTITSNPPNRSVCAGNNTTFTVAATGATAYKWQIDPTASGSYTDLSNSAPYSGVTSNTLTITGVTAGLNGAQYRAVAINGTATCFTNSNFGILNVSNISTATGGGQTNVSCNGGTNGTATVSPTGGIGTYTYSWSPSGGTAATASGLTAGTYTVTVTDGITCQATRNYTITQPAVLSAATGGGQTNVSCNGGTNGTATVSPTGGTGAYTYSWAPSGGTAATASGLAAGTYTVTVTDANSCTATRNYTITQPTVLSAATGGGQTNVSCNGGANGTATVSPTGGTGAYTYSWAPSGGTAATASGLAAGTYTVTVTDANSCTATRNYTITQPAVLSAATGGGQTNVSCNGGTNGTATVSPTGGTGAYTYSWAPSGGTAATASGLTAGTYTVTVTDANSCTATRNYTITQPAVLNAATGGGQTNVSCNGGTNGTATVSPTGGTGAYTYSWAPSGGTAATASGLVAGTYTVTVTDANSCTATRNYTITQPAVLSAATGGGQTNVSCNGGTNGTATVSPTGGTGAYTYSWAPSGGTAATASGLAAGTYTVTVTDANSCTATRNYTITQPAVLSAATGGGQTNVSCNSGANGTATVSPTGGTGAYTYSWAPSGGTAATASGLVAGTYTVTVTDANSCTATRNYTITQPAILSASTGGGQTNVSCGGSDGSATVSPTGGTGAYTYFWSPSGGTAATASGLSVGTYTVTVTDANLCTATRSYTLISTTAINVTAASQTNIACNGASNGTAAINAATGGSGPCTYDWAPGTPTGDGTLSITGLTAGTYTVTATDAGGCTGSQSFTITEPAALTVLAGSQTNISCNGGSNGSATVTTTGGTGAYSYSWSPSGGAGATASGLAAGSYTVTVTDANSCTATQSFTITEPAALAITENHTNITCNGQVDGSATVTVTGGTGVYTYSWSPSGGTAAAASGLAAGTYTVTITDDNVCTATQSITITEPSVIATTGGSTNVNCNGGTDGNATVTSTGGTGAYTYSWAPSGGTAATASGLAAGTYTVTVTDANGCTATQSFTITEPSTPLTATATAGSAILCNGGSTTVDIAAAGGTLNYTGTGTLSAVAGNHVYTVTDANGCTATATVTITEPTAIVVTSAHTDVTCNGDADGQANISVTGGTGAYTYSWSPSGGPSTTASGLAAGTYTVTVTDANNCTATKTVVISQPNAITFTQNVTLCPGQTVSVGTHTYATAGTYTDILSSTVSGCDSTVTTTITTVPSVNLTTTLNGNTITANATGVTYQWINCTNDAPITGATFQSFTALTNGSFAVVITNSCMSDTSDCVTINTIGLQELSDNWNATLYPNPSKGSVTIDWGISLNNVAVEITDVTGKIVYQATVEKASSHKVELKQPSGIYYVRVSNEQEHVVLKLVNN